MAWTYVALAIMVGAVLIALGYAVILFGGMFGG